jgi:hypothetical protein
LKTRCALLSLLTLICLLLSVSAVAGDTTLYDNGPTTGTADGWTINFGFAVSDSFVCCNGSPDFSLESASFIFWLSPGDTAPTIDLSIGTTAFGSDIATLTGLTATSTTSLGSNQYGFNLEQDNYTFANIDLLPGTYWITLQNASVPSGDPVYWDENSGPSMAQENTLGTIPSESFTLDGTPTQSTTTTGTTPEPSSIMLFGSGALALAGMLRRRMFY